MAFTFFTFYNDPLMDHARFNNTTVSRCRSTETLTIGYVNECNPNTEQEKTNIIIVIIIAV